MKTDKHSKWQKALAFLKRLHLVICIFIAFSSTVYGLPGDLDTNFGGTGKVTTAIGTGNDYAYSVLVQSDGKVLAGGYSRNASGNDDFAIVRYNADGTLDTTFNGTGKVTTAIGLANDNGLRMALQADGKILLTGYFAIGSTGVLAVVRYNADGTLDSSFNGTGIVTTQFAGYDSAQGESVAVQSDGKIVVAGEAHIGFYQWFVAVTRYNPDGTLDGTFNGSGKSVVGNMGGGDDHSQSVAIQSDGKIVVTGYTGADIAVVRFNSNGTLDTGFNTTGYAKIDIGGGTDIGQSVIVQADGKILVSGSSHNGTDYDFALLRYNSNGTLDTSFRGTGKVTTSVLNGNDQAYGMALQSDGKIVVAGYAYNGANNDFAVVRFNADGTLDTTFHNTSKVTTAIGTGDDTGRAVAIAPDGKIVVAGYSYNGTNYDFAVVRYLNTLTVPPAYSVEQPAGNKLASGISRLDYGQVLTGTTVSKTFVINNTSPSVLTIGTMTIDGVNGTDFTLSTYPTSPLAPGTSTSFTVNFAPGALYGRSAILHIPSSDSIQPVFDITLIGVGSLPAFSVQATSTVVHLGDANATVTVERNFSQPASVDYATAGDTAVAGLDFTPTTGTLSFAQGELTKDITVPLLYRINAPNPAYFTVQLSNPSLIAGLSVPTVIGIPGSEGIYMLNDHPTDLSLSQISTTPFTVTQPQTAPGATASLSVTLSPAQAGGQWRLFGELAWRNSGTVAPGLTSGNYGVEFKPANGYVAPAVQIVPVTAGAAATTSATYVATGTPLLGSLRIDLTPSNLGLGGWRLQGETTYRASGATALNLVTGSYVVEFAAVAGRVTPAARVATITSGTTTNISAVYLIDFAPQGATPQLVSVANRMTAPYCFTGQIQTDSGFGTGFVPLDRIVVTAAHVLFDDAKLSFAEGVRWFFQNEANAFEAPPQIPRGSYVMAGYAAQRAADHSPDLASGASRQLDAAVMYFLEPTARGGQSGYLASNLPTNTWLKSPRDKFLAGYPTQGLGVTPGLLYATPTVTNAFTFVTGSLFSTTAMGSYPGNSGGPVFVRADDNSFYPAAIYLGGTNETVVRAIDSQIIDMMKRGQVSGNGGANNTDAGVSIVQSPLGTTATTTGFIKVNLAPAGVATTARWTLSSDSIPRNSGFSVSKTAPASYAVSFSPVAGYTAPAPVSVPVAAATETQVTATYAPLVPQYTVTPGAGLGGSITPSAAQVLNSGGSVTFTAIPDPATAVYPNIGRSLVDQWYLDGNSMQVGGAIYTLTNVTANHTVLATFKQFTVTSSAGLNGNIIPNSAQPDGSIWFIASPNAGYAVDQWLVNSAPVQTGGTTYVLSGVTANTAVQVTFRAASAPVTYIITPSAGTGGTISPNTPPPINSGAGVTFIATPNSGYAVDQWLLDGVAQAAQAGSTTFPLNNIVANHTVQVTFVANSINATLSNLTMSAGQLSPSFASSTMNYTVSLPKTALTFSLTPTVAEPGATVTVNGTPVPSGNSSAATNLAVGSGNGFSIVVTAPNHVTKTYAVTVTRSSRNSPADINNDAKDDLVFQNNAGQLAAWDMDGKGGITSSGYLYGGGLGDWRLAAKADLNGDGNADLIYQNGVGQIYVWFLDGTGNGIDFSGGSGLKPGSRFLYGGGLADWRVVACADINGDGFADLIFQNSVGQIYVWFLDGTGNGIDFTTGSGLKPGAKFLYGGGLADWRVTCVGDFNADGNADLIFQNNASQIYVWFLDGSGNGIDFSTGSGLKPGSTFLSTGNLGDWRVR